MPKTNYFFQQKRRSFTQRFFEKGLNAAAYILLALKEAGEGFLKDLPDCYPSFKLMKATFGVGNYGKTEFKKEVLKVNFYRLEKQGLIAKEPKKKVYYLTEEGKKLVAYIKDRYSTLQEKWDGKFRLVMFDIPDSKKEWRKWLPQELKLLQFQMLQQSVYIGKHPLPKSFYQEINETGLSKYVFVLTVGEVDRLNDMLRILN